VDTIISNLFGIETQKEDKEPYKDPCLETISKNILNEDPYTSIIKHGVDYPDELLKDIVKQADSKGKNVLTELRYYKFIKIDMWCLYENDSFRSLHISHIGKIKTGVWEPYLNFYAAYTPPEFRRRKFASKLYFQVRQEAIKDGCKRIKSLAGSKEGLMFHHYFNDQFWAMTEHREILIDTPLINCEFPKAAPRKVRKWVKDRSVPLSLEEVKQLGKLRYD
jgi:hypothetical protein